MPITLNRDALAYVPAKLKLFVSLPVTLSETRSAMIGRKVRYRDGRSDVALLVAVDLVLEQR